jgi:asparagine synthase (glutamine-hydrolysing)
MCGIAGYIRTADLSRPPPPLAAALALMRHRGPDDTGVERLHCGNTEIGLGHARLSVIDLSVGGHQPMHAGDGRLAIVFNGEIYNDRELRAELAAAGVVFTTASDTEVLLQAWAAWGPGALTRLVGMFAFAILDRVERTLTLVRDGFGIKPLFVAEARWGWCFASELPACVALRGAGAQLELQRAVDYLLHGDYDSTASSFVEGVQHLEPGTLRVLSLDTGHLREQRRWWAPAVAQRGRPRFAEAADELRTRFLDTVRLHLRSDVPLGAALSGGIDSSAVVHAIRHLEPDAPLHTFSFVARGFDVSEERWIDLANAGVGARAHRVIVDPAELTRDLDDMIQAQGEPFGSTSIYAQYRVFKLARDNGITVTLDGQGADELMGGYLGYPGPRLHSLIDRGQLLAARSFLNHWAQWPGRERQQALQAAVGSWLPGPLYQVARWLKERGTAQQAPDWMMTDRLRDEGIRLDYPRQTPDPWPRGRRMVAELALSATRRGLPALLRHADRNSMRFSVESRVPFLTTPLADFLLGLPEDFLVSAEGSTKHVFRAAMRGIVPDTILDRRDKIGFATPEKDWLTALSASARAWLDDAHQIDFLRAEELKRGFDAVLAGTQPFSWQAWRWINFIRWYVRVFVPMQSAPPAEAI